MDVDTRGVSAAFLRRFLRGLEAQHAGRYLALTTRDARDLVVRPRTQGRKCAYVDVVEQETPGDVAQANVFVSHAWRYKITDVLGALLEYADARDREHEQQHGEGQRPPPLYFWFDLFLNNQHILADLPQEWWSTTFRGAIARIGHVVLVLAPWSDPIPLTRAWCLWEIYSALSQENVDLTIQMPASERQSLIAEVLQDVEAVTDTMVRVQAEKAKAWSESDRAMIFAAIEDTVGFTRLNEAVKNRMRTWCLSTMTRAVDAQLLATAKTPTNPPARCLHEQHQQEQEQQEQQQREVLAQLCLQAGSVLRRFGWCEEAKQYLEKALALFSEAAAAAAAAAASKPDEKGSHPSHSNDSSSADSDSSNADKSSSNDGKTSSSSGPNVVGHEGLDALLAADMAAATHQLAALHTDKGEFDEAARLYLHALSLKSHVTARSESDERVNPTAAKRNIASTHSNLSQVYRRMAAYEDAEKHASRAVDILMEAVGPVHMDTGSALSNLGAIHHVRGDYAAARACHEKCLQAQLQSRGEMHPATAETYNSLGCCLRRMGEYQAAKEAHEKALRVFVTTVGEMHARTAESYSNLGSCHGSLNDQTLALECHSKAVEINKAVHGAEHEATAISTTNLAMAYEAVGRLDDSAAQHEAAARVFAARLGPHHPHTGVSYRNLGDVYKSKKEFARALEWYERSLGISLATVGEQHPSTAMVLFNMGSLEAWLASGTSNEDIRHKDGGGGDGGGDGGGGEQSKVSAIEQVKEGIRKQERALAALMATVGPDHPHTKHIGASLARWREGDDKDRKGETGKDEDMHATEPGNADGRTNDAEQQTAAEEGEDEEAEAEAEAAAHKEDHLQQGWWAFGDLGVVLVL